MNDGDPRAAANLPSASAGWVTLMSGLGWLIDLPKLWESLRSDRSSRFGITRIARLALLGTVSACIGCAVSGGAVSWGVGIYASLLVSACLLGWWFVGLTRHGTALRRKAGLFSAAWLALLLLAPLLAWIEWRLLNQMGLYAVPLALLAAPLLAWTGLHGQDIAAAAPKAARDTVHDWGWARGLNFRERQRGERGMTWSGKDCSLTVTIDDTRSPTRTTLRAQPGDVLENLSLRRGKDTRLNDVILNECLQTTGDPALAARVLTGHHEDFLPALHGLGFRIERGEVRATLDGNPTPETLEAAWRLVLALDSRGREVR